VAEVFFHQLLAPVHSSLGRSEDPIYNYIPLVLTSDDNKQLSVLPTYEEVKVVVFSFNKNSAPSADGFTGVFFTHCWDIVGSVVVADVCPSLL
jgi:hypothetical protein